MRFDYVIKHVPGKSLHTADALSRAPLKHTMDSDEQAQVEEIEFHVSEVISALPVSSTRLTAFSQAQAEDSLDSMQYIDFLLHKWMARQTIHARIYETLLEPSRRFLLTSQSSMYCIKIALQSQNNCKRKSYRSCT